MSKIKWFTGVILANLVASQSTHANDFEMALGVASDYVYRGISQTGEDPAVQAKFVFKPTQDVYLRLFASEVSTPWQGNLELELASGYQLKLNDDFDLIGELVYSAFTDENNGDSDYLEGNLMLHYKQFAALTLGYTSDYFGTNEAATYAEGRFNLPLHDVIKTAVYLGRYSIDGAALESYSLMGFDAWTNIGNIEFKLSFSDTDLENADNADSRIFVTASYQF
ncbi:MAG: hypothetical protein HWE11_16605 [Gammaproteobacteria bacterium]|nr:hypothetical protein [Gammaproteobacteria bacterium]